MYVRQLTGRRRGGGGVISVRQIGLIVACSSARFNFLRGYELWNPKIGSQAVKKNDHHCIIHVPSEILLQKPVKLVNMAT
jgi:hypothetical protein